MSKHEYRAVHNYFKNTQKLAREELEDVVKDVIVDIVKERVDSYMQSVAFRNMVTKHIKESASGYVLNSIASDLKKRIALSLVDE